MGDGFAGARAQSQGDIQAGGVGDRGPSAGMITRLGSLQSALDRVVARPDIGARERVVPQGSRADRDFSTSSALACAPARSDPLRVTRRAACALASLTHARTHELS